MQKFNHTLGRREARKIDWSKSKVKFVDQNGDIVKYGAFVLSENGEIVIGRFAKYEDAVLDAAAPELLKALRGARLMLYAWSAVRTKEGKKIHKELQDTITEIETAIAKATGSI